MRRTVRWDALPSEANTQLATELNQQSYMYCSVRKYTERISGTLCRRVGLRA